MAETDDIINKTIEKLASKGLLASDAIEKAKGAGKELNNELSRSTDLSKQLVNAFRELSKLQNDNAAKAQGFASFSKIILSDAKARETIERRISYNMEKFEDDILDARLKLYQAEQNYFAQKTDESRQARDDAAKALNDKVTELNLERSMLKDVRLRSGFMAHIAKSNYEVFGSMSKVVQQGKMFAENAKVTPLRFMALAELLKISFERFEALDAAAEKFRRDTGFTTDQMKSLRVTVEKINVDFANIGATIEKVYDAAKGLLEVFGTLPVLTERTLKTTVLLSENLNVAAADTANVLATFRGLGGVSEDVAENIIRVGAGFSKDAGVPFSLVMKDIAGLSQETLELLGSNPSKLMKATIAARAMGVELNKLVSAQTKLLDFSSSITSELEASALIGKSVNFQKARLLAYEEDSVGAAKEILRVVKSVGDFDSLRIYQRKALAAASGMELKDMSKMMAIEKMRDEIRRTGTAEERKKLEMQEQALEALEKESKLDSKRLLDQRGAEITAQQMQGIMTQLKNTFQSIVVALADILEPIITPLMKIIVPAFKFVGVLVKLLTPLIKALVYPIEWIATKLSEWADYLSAALDNSKGFKNFFENDIVKGILGTIGGAAGLIGLIFYGKAGAKKVFDMVKKPFSFVKDLAKDGVSDAAKNASDAAKSSASAGQSSGTGIMKFLKGLAAGLREMGTGRVLAGAFNLIPAAAGLVVMIPGAVGAKIIEKLNGPKLFESLSGLASGLKQMGTAGVLFGSANLVAASVALLLMIPGVVGAKLIELVDGPKLQASLTGLAKGLSEMASVKAFAGAANLIMASVGLTAMIAGSIGMAAIGATGAFFQAGAIAMAAGLSALANPTVLLGILGLLGIGGAFALFGLGAKLMADAFVSISTVIPQAIIPLTQLALLSPLLFVAAAGIGALTISLLLLAGSAVAAGIASAGVYLIAVSIEKLGKGFESTGKGVALFSKGIRSSIEPLKQFSQLRLKDIADSLKTMNSALSNFGSSSIANSVGDFIKKILGVDPLQKIEKLAEVGQKLNITAEAMSKITIAASNFSVINAFSDAIIKLANSLSTLNTNIDKLNLDKLSAISSASQTAGTAVAATVAPLGNMSGIESKLDSLISLMTEGKIIAVVDLDKLTTRVATKSGT